MERKLSKSNRRATNCLVLAAVLRVFFQAPVGEDRQRALSGSGGDATRRTMMMMMMGGRRRGGQAVSSTFSPCLEDRKKRQAKIAARQTRCRRISDIQSDLPIASEAQGILYGHLAQGMKHVDAPSTWNTPPELCSSWSRVGTRAVAGGRDVKYLISSHPGYPTQE